MGIIHNLKVYRTKKKIRKRIESERENNENITILLDNEHTIKAPYYKLIVGWKTKDEQVTLNYYRQEHEVSEHWYLPENYMVNLKTKKRIVLPSEEENEDSIFMTELYSKNELRKCFYNVSEEDLKKRLPVKKMVMNQKRK